MTENELPFSQRKLTRFHWLKTPITSHVPSLVMRMRWVPPAKNSIAEESSEDSGSVTRGAFFANERTSSSGIGFPSAASLAICWK